MSATLTPPVRRKANRWVEAITEAWRAAHDAWEAKAEEVAVGYAVELAEFRQTHPEPRLKDFMVHLSQKETSS